jgi:hypothetical protein
MPEKTPNPNVTPWDISPEDERSFQATDASFAWLCQLPSETIRPYAGKWIAVGDCQIVACAETLEALRAQFQNGEWAKVIAHRVERPGKVIYR